MLKRIENTEIMTSRQAMEKYRTMYFVFVITDVVDGQDNDRGYVIYTGDSEEELSGIPREELKGMTVEFSLGVAAEPIGVDRVVISRG